MRKNDHKIAIISGGIDDIALATMEKFTTAGYMVHFWDSDERKGRVIVSELKAKKMMVEFFQADTTDLQKMEVLARQVFDKYKRIDVLINNSSSADAFQNEWSETLDRSLKGVMNCIKAVSPYMLLNNYGRIINTTALLGVYGDVNQVNYTAVKNGVLGISKIWLMELSRHNVTVNTVAPGYIEGDFTGKNTAIILKSIKEKIPSRRIGKPMDIANAYFFLASDEAAYINGTILTVDGGYTV